METKLQALDYGTSPAKIDVRATPAGGVVMGDWLHLMVARGFGWHVEVGAFSTPITGGGAGTVLDQDQPELTIDVPTGFCSVPLRIHVQCQTPLIATDSDESEILIAVDRAAAGGATATNGTVETPLNMRTNVTNGCPNNVVSAVTTNMTNPTLGMELAHAVKVGDVQGVAATALWGDLSLLYEAIRPPFVIGPATILVYWGGTVATTGFCQADWLTFPATMVTNLV